MLSKMAQNSGSSATDVAWPESRTDRLIKLLNGLARLVYAVVSAIVRGMDGYVQHHMRGVGRRGICKVRLRLIPDTHALVFSAIGGLGGTVGK